MIRKLLLALLTAVSLSAPAAAGEYEDAMLRVTERMPRDVVRFIYRRVDCNHWMAQDPDDPGVRRHMRSLRCYSLPREERYLRRIYARRPSVIQSINEAFGMEF